MFQYSHYFIGEETKPMEPVICANSHSLYGVEPGFEPSQADSTICVYNSYTICDYTWP